jgi:hypothetical protein
MIPNSGRRHTLNLGAEFTPAERGVASVPTIIIGGARLSVYADSNGVLCVTLATDEEDLDPRFDQDRQGRARIKINVNDMFSLNC